MKKLLLSTIVSLLFTSPLNAQSLTVNMIDLKSNNSVGTITISQNKYGTVFTPNLHHLSPGIHAFHVHENGSCGSTETNGKTILGGAAGKHYDPDNTNKHGYPWTDDNHRGDLPSLYANAHGHVTTPVLAPRLTIDELKNRSIMLHEGGDNHADHPMPHGGGGMRMLCGVISG